MRIRRSNIMKERSSSKNEHLIDKEERTDMEGKLH